MIQRVYILENDNYLRMLHLYNNKSIVLLNKCHDMSNRWTGVAESMLIVVCIFA